MALHVIESIVRKKLEKGERITLELAYPFGIDTGRLDRIRRAVDGDAVVLSWENIIFRDNRLTGSQTRDTRVDLHLLEEATFKQKNGVWVLKVRLPSNQPKF